MIEQFLAWLQEMYFDAVTEAQKAYPYAAELNPRVAFQRGREMAFYTAQSFIRRHRDLPEATIRANFHSMHTATIYLDDGNFTNGFNEAALEIKKWLATHHA